jgi:uncharacterized protein YoxC
MTAQEIAAAIIALSIVFLMIYIAMRENDNEYMP